MTLASPSKECDRPWKMFSPVPLGDYHWVAEDEGGVPAAAGSARIYKMNYSLQKIFHELIRFSARRKFGGVSLQNYFRLNFLIAKIPLIKSLKDS